MWSLFRSGISRRGMKVILKSTIVSHVNPLKKSKSTFTIFKVKNQKMPRETKGQEAGSDWPGRRAVEGAKPSLANRPRSFAPLVFQLSNSVQCELSSSRCSVVVVVCVRVARVSWCTRPVMSVIVVRGNQPTPIFCDPDPPIPCSNVVEVCLLSSSVLSRSVWLSSFSWGWFLLDYVSPLFVFHRFSFRNFDFSNWHIERIEIRRPIWPCSNFLTTLFREILNVVN